MSYKVVQSFWTKPLFNENVATTHHRLKGGWPSEKYNYYSWALSCLQLRKYYDDVELVTDTYGKSVLIDKLALPYSSVRIDLDHLDSYNSDLWALGKIFTYKLQDQSFIHLDGDVFIWEHLPESLWEAPLVAQNIENEPQLYGKAIEAIYQTFSFIPAPLKDIDFNAGRIHAVNAGILGGSDIRFFQHYADTIFNFLEANSQCLPGIDKGVLNCVYEQLVFYNLARMQGIEISFLFPGVTSIPTNTKTFRLLKHQTKYVHPYGVNKKNKFTYLFLEYYLEKLYPDYYYRIKNMVNTMEL